MNLSQVLTVTVPVSEVNSGIELPSWLMTEVGSALEEVDSVNRSSRSNMK